MLLALSGMTPGVEITSPEDSGVYSSPGMDVRAVLDYENLLADSVLFSLNGGAWCPLPRLDTDWYTYMQNDLHHGFSESPAPHDATVLWTAPICSTIHEFPNPVIVDGIVYYPSNMGTDSLYALDPLTGEVIWKYLVGQTDDAVTVKDGFLYIASDSLWCLDASTGERIWASAVADWSGSTPAVDGGRVYAGRNVTGVSSVPWVSSVFSCLDAATGEPVWSTALVWGQASCPTVWNGLVIIPTSHGPLYALDMEDGSIVWSNWDAGDEGYWDSSPTVADGVIYIGDETAHLRAIDASSGETIWMFLIGNAPGNLEITATPACLDGRIFVGASYGPFICADASSGEVLWSEALTIHGSPCVADGLVFFGETIPVSSCARFLALDCEDGSMVWEYEVEAPSFQGTPAVCDGIMYISAIDGNLYAFGTGYKFSYDGQLTAEIGWNELIVNAFCPGGTVLADTVSFLVDPYGIEEGQPTAPYAPVLRVIGNPAGDCAGLVLMSPSQAAAGVRVFDLSGRVVIDCDIPEGPDRSIELDVSGFPPGVYPVRWEQEGACGTASLVVLR